MKNHFLMKSQEQPFQTGPFLKHQMRTHSGAKQFSFGLAFLNITCKCTLERNHCLLMSVDQPFQTGPPLNITREHTLELNNFSRKFVDQYFHPFLFERSLLNTHRREAMKCAKLHFLQVLVEKIYINVLYYWTCYYLTTSCDSSSLVRL